MKLDARISNGFTTVDGITFSNGEATMTTVGGGGFTDGYPSIRPSIVFDNNLNKNVLKYVATCPTDTNGSNITRSQVDLTSPSWIRTLENKWIYWDVYLPDKLFKQGHMIAILSLYSNNSGAPAIRPGCFHAFIGDGTEGVQKGYIGFRSNTSDWYPRLVASIPPEKFYNKWTEIIVNIDLEGNNKDGNLHIWADGVLVYSACRTNTVYADTIDVHYKVGGMYFWATSPSSGEFISYSSGMVVSNDNHSIFESFAKDIGARIQKSTVNMEGVIKCSSNVYPY